MVHTYKLTCTIVISSYTNWTSMVVQWLRLCFHSRWHRWDFKGENIFSVQFSCSVLLDSLLLHELQHTRSPCTLPALRDYPNICPLSRWYHPTLSSFIISFSSCPQSFPAAGSFQRVSSSHQVAKILEL